MPLGPSTVDANGILMFGEDEPTGPLFSDFLNLLAQSVSAKFTGLALPFATTSSALRDTHWGTPATAAARRALQDLGATTIRTDTGRIERYYAGLTDGGANPGGATVAGWYPVGGRMPCVLLARNATAYTTFPNNAYTQITNTHLGTDLADDATTAGGAITIVTPGRYRLSAAVSFVANATGARTFAVTKNSAVVPPTSSVLYASAPASAGGNSTMVGSREILLAAGDVLRLFALQNSGGNLTLLTAAEAVGGTYFSATYVGPF